MLVDRKRLCHSDKTSLGMLKKVGQGIGCKQRQRSLSEVLEWRAQASVATGDHVINALLCHFLSALLINDCPAKTDVSLEKHFW